MAEGSIRLSLRAELRKAMKQRDRQAVSVFRSALAAIDNAEAVPLTEADRASAIEASPAGAGRADVPRRVLTEAQMIDIVRAEIDELAASMTTVDAADDAATELRRSVALLRDIIAQQAGSPS